MYVCLLIVYIILLISINNSLIYYRAAFPAVRPSVRHILVVTDKTA